MAGLLNNLHVLHWINSLQINVQDSGYAELNSEWQRRDVCSPFSRLYYIRHGVCWASSGDSRALLREGRMYLIPLGYRYDYGCDGSVGQLYFHINITLPNGLDLFSKCTQIYELPMERAEIERLVLLYRSPDMTDALAIACCLYRDVAAFIARAGIEAKMSFAYSETTQQILPLVRKRLSAKLTIGDLAQEMNVSQSTLVKRFSREMEMTLGAYIDTMLFQRCQQLLLFTDRSIREISDSLEFCDQFYFSRFFKQHQHETPTGYRRRLKAGIRAGDAEDGASTKNG